MIDVVWLDYREDSQPRGYWDQGTLEHIFAGTWWPTSKRHQVRHHLNTWPEDARGGVVVFKGGNNADMLHMLKADMDEHFPDWVLLVITGDEESLVEWSRISHANMRMWIALPRPLRHRDCPDGTRYFGCGVPPDAVERLDCHTAWQESKPLDWFYSGQVNHGRRRKAVAAAKALTEPGRLVETEGFTQGLPRGEYYEGLAMAKLSLCPSGPTTPDTFRLWESLEAGCLPLVDAQTPGDLVPGYWEFLIGGTPPFPLIDNWAGLDTLVPDLLNGWPDNANRVVTWWQRHKRDMAHWLLDDIQQMRGPEPDVVSDVTFLVATSPIPTHPDPSITVDTVESLKAQCPDAEIIIMCDGVRAEQEHRRGDYVEYLRRLSVKCAREWDGVVMRLFDGLTQQAEMIRQTLPLVRTPYMMFVEHDTPLTGDIPWEQMKEAVASGDADMIRLYPNTDLEPSHAHMMLDRQTIAGLPLLRTYQYSSRPHLCTVAFMQRMLDTWFTPGEVQFLELRMHSVMSRLWTDHGMHGWNQCKTWIYEPEGNLQRSLHTNGREGDPAFPT